VWDWGSDDRNKPWRIQSVYRAPGGSWSRVAAVTPARGNRDPQVGMAVDGTAVLLYTRQPQGHPQSLLSKRRHVGAGWTQATTVAARGYVPKLTVDGAGDAVVVFMPAVNRVMAAYRHRGSHWGAPRRLTPRGARLDGVCAAAMNGSGTTLVVWVDRHGRVDLVRRPPRGPWSAPARVVGTTDQVSHVAVGLNRDGDTFLAWGEYALAGVYRPHGGRWSSRTTLSFGDGVEVLEGVQAEVAPNGDAFVLWEQEGMPLRARVGSRS
jgi:hypothetical protein